MILPEEDGRSTLDSASDGHEALKRRKQDIASTAEEGRKGSNVDESGQRGEEESSREMSAPGRGGSQ